MPVNIGGATFVFACLRDLVFGPVFSSSKLIIDRARFRVLIVAVDDCSFIALVFWVAGEEVEA